MKKLMVLIVVILSVALVGAAFAVPMGKTASFETKMGTVTFDGGTHAKAGLKCNNCHPKLFPMKKGGASYAAPHSTDVGCGTCHNGEKAFSVKKDCKMCHKK